jgi:hypothetical protein
MGDPTMTLSPTQAAILSAAARHPERLAAPPPKLAPTPRDAVRKSLLARGLIEPTAEVLDPATAWSVDAVLVNYRITEAGLRAIGAECQSASNRDPRSACNRDPPAWGRNGPRRRA